MIPISVYKSRRKDAAAQFIADARELRIRTMRAVRKFPTSYRWIVTNNMLELAGSIYTNAIKANSIYPHKEMCEQDFELRHRYLILAISETEALLAEISFCYSLISDGNNFFKNRADYERVFSGWLEIGNATLARLRGVVNSDRKRQAAWKNGYKAEAESES